MKLAVQTAYCLFILLVWLAIGYGIWWMVGPESAWQRMLLLLFELVGGGCSGAIAIVAALAGSVAIDDWFYKRSKR